MSDKITPILFGITICNPHTDIHRCSLSSFIGEQEIALTFWHAILHILYHLHKMGICNEYTP